MKRAITFAAGMLLQIAGPLPAAGPAGLGESFSYDLSKYRKTDPALVRYRETAAFPVQGEAPSAISAGPGDRIYAAGNRWMLILDAGGRTVSEIEIDGPVTALHAGRDGTVYLGRGRHVETRDGAGQTPSPWPDLGEKALVTGIAASSNAVFVADSGQRMVWRFDRTGRMLGTVETEDRIILPSPCLDAAPEPAGTFLVNHPGRLRVERYNAEGKKLAQWGKASMKVEEGFCGCCNPTRLAVGPGGRVFTSEKGITRIKEFDASGQFAGVVAGAEHFDEDTVARIAVDSRGRVWVLDPKRKSIRLFEKK